MTSTQSSMPYAAPLPDGRQILTGVVNRLILPSLAVFLVLWNTLFLLNSMYLMPANDFGRMVDSAVAFTEGRDMYAWSRATPAKLEKDFAIDLYNMNPPHWHLLLLPLTLLHPDHALVVWWVLSGLCLCHCLRWIFRETAFELTESTRRWGVLALLAFSGTTAMLATSQLSFVLLVPITLMWLAARRGLWGWAGVCLGLALSVKPFLGVVLVYLVWRRHWRGLASCLVTVVLCFAVGLAVFGLDNHLSWRHRLTVSEGWAWLPMNAGLAGMLVRTFSESAWYVPLVRLSIGTVWGLWLIIGGIMGLVTVGLTSRGNTPEGIDRDLALVLAASVLLCPLGWIYYLWLVLPPLFALIARARKSAEAHERQGAARAAVGRRGLFLFAGVAFLWPIIGTRLFQPHSSLLRSEHVTGIEAVGTLFIGNVFFWGLLALWIGLAWLAWVRRNQPSPQMIPQLSPLDAADYRVSIVMPVFSETASVRQITTWLSRELGTRLEEIIIVQSPRSSAASRTVCRELADEFAQVRWQIQQNNPGLGHAVREGFANVRGNVVLMIDSDGEMGIDTVPRLLAEMAKGNHGLVVASRWLPGGGFTGYGKLKYRLNWCFQQLFRWLFWTRIHDLTYGFKLLRTELVRGIHWQGTLHEIACETTLKPIRLGISAAEVPSVWTARTQGASKNTFWRNFRYVRMALGILFRGVPFSAAHESTKHPVGWVGSARPTGNAGNVCPQSVGLEDSTHPTDVPCIA
jgi:dolichol-phosphate mannosyltransferase